MQLHELHAHLYGCLDSHTVWQAGRDRWSIMSDRLDWYADSYEKAWGRKPDWRAYWQAENGLELLEQDFIVRRPVTFPQFQACFNLLIALWPLDPEDSSVFRHMVASQTKSGVEYGEYRMFLPSDPTAASALLHMAIATLREPPQQATKFEARLVISLPRAMPAGRELYHWLRDWRAMYPELAPWVVGVDFCADEEAAPWGPQFELMAEISRDNQQNPERALAILTHAGESFQRRGPAIAVGELWQAVAAGSHRIGHALALGLKGQQFLRDGVVKPEYQQPSWRPHQAEQLEHLSWLRKAWETIDVYDGELRPEEINGWIREVKAQTADTVHGLFHDFDHIAWLQELTMKWLRDQSVVIECCPTSNMRLAGLSELGEHPLPRFIAAGLDCVIGADDPGLFGQELHDEYRALVKIDLDPEEIRQLAARSTTAHSAMLAKPQGL